jgi:sortase (surface protein transpeptidase)
MFEKYVRKIIEYRILLSGIALIAVGTFLCYIGQNEGNRFDDKPLRQSISEKTSQIDKLVSSKNELLSRIDEYQKKLLEKDEVIQRLEASVDKINVPVPEKSTDEETEAGSQVIMEN